MQQVRDQGGVVMEGGGYYEPPTQVPTAGIAPPPAWGGGIPSHLYEQGWRLGPGGQWIPPGSMPAPPAKGVNPGMPVNVVPPAQRRNWPYPGYLPPPNPYYSFDV